jgi:hypothetical protein
MQIEKQEREAEEEGGTAVGGTAQVVMDVDSGVLEGEHLTQVCVRVYVCMCARVRACMCLGW